MKTITTEQAVSFIINADRVYVDDYEVRPSGIYTDELTLTHINTDGTDEWYGTSWSLNLGSDFTYQLSGNKIYAAYDGRGSPEEITLFKETPYCPGV